MTTASLTAFDRRLYRTALALFPASFRRDHGAEMARDFDEAREEAADDHRAVWQLRGCMAIDLLRTFAVQWFRTGIPLIAVASVVVTLAVVAGIANVARRVNVPMPAGFEHEETVVVLFIAQISVVLIATTILLSLWVGRQMRRRRR